MVRAVVVGRLTQLVLIGPGDDRSLAFPRTLPFGPDTEGGPEPLPAALERSVAELPPDTELRADTDAWAEALGAARGAPVPIASLGELRRARASVPPVDPALERRALLTLARARLEGVLRSPGEVLVSLAREEERLERASGREARAAEAFLAPSGTPLAEYAEAWAAVRVALERHHAALLERLSAQARAVVPNLSAVVGARTAARLVAAAGGVEAAGRLRAPRLQLLGTRRRPSAEHGPRYGIVYRADRMADVPPDRRGAYARSLSALAAIAARADATTHADLAAALVARRDRRVEQLRRRRA
ncbi:MAG TPA: hypothetical protein VEL82_07120 [Thermoplasmata archaeon]|nr:hypothetical protein [Thermoplasmata archaeon]